MGMKYKPGVSLRAFQKFSPESIIDGAEIDKNITVNGSNVFFVDQTKPETFLNIIEGGQLKYDLIIDEGMHSRDSQLFTLNFALKHISERGYIVIEDIPERALPIWNLVRYTMISTSYTCNLIKDKTAYLFLCTNSSTGLQLLK
jgi:hypothetical protein